MVLDSSALISILLQEPEREHFLIKIARASVCCVSAATVVETAIVILSRKSQLGVDEFSNFLQAFDVDVVPFDREQATIANQAYAKYGKGQNHPAHLNLGDCYSYALAKHLNQPLLFKGNDFIYTDIEAA